MYKRITQKDQLSSLEPAMLIQKRVDDQSNSTIITAKVFENNKNIETLKLAWSIDDGGFIDQIFPVNAKGEVAIGSYTHEPFLVSYQSIIDEGNWEIED